MAKGTGTTSVKVHPTLWQKTAGPILAARWSQQQKPPIGTDKAVYYAAALASGTLSNEVRGRVARCLVWCDFYRSSFEPASYDWYKAAFLAFPEDERCAFFAAYLCSKKELTDPDLAVMSYRKVLRPQWKNSKFWKRFTLSKRTLLIELGVLYAEQAAETTSAEAIEIIEAALNLVGESDLRRPVLLSFLCRVYQMQGRTDEYAESAYRWVFTHVPDNIQNRHYLAELYRQNQRSDTNACAVYTQMAMLADKEGNKDEADQWTLLLARAYIEHGQIHKTPLSVFERAEKLKTDDLSIAAAYLSALAYHYITKHGSTTAGGVENEDQAVIPRLEEAIAREVELRPVFESLDLEWVIVLRALALAYGHQNRADADAQSLYARAIWSCPEDIAVWSLHASALADRKDYSEGALAVYEKVIHEPACNESVLVALAHAYIGLQAEKDKEHRPNALIVWERLYQKGNHWPELITALAAAYMQEGRVNDTAVSLWEKQVADSPRNGVLRLRLAQELRQRGDLHSSVRYYKEAAKLLPRDFDAQFETGLVLKDNYADYTSAIKLLQKAIKLPKGQKHLHAHFSLAEALLFRDERAEAKIIFQKIIEVIDPEHTPTLLHLAKLNLKYEEEGVRLAEALYTQASAISPDNAETYRGMADLYREKGQSEDEEQALEKYLMLSEPDAKRYRQLADLYIRKGDFIRAEGALRQVITLGEGNKQLYTLLGEVILQGSIRAAA
jgi:tetratricopeptide (TPR) repeat protein